MIANSRRGFPFRGEALYERAKRMGEGAEYILLPSADASLLIVRQFRSTGNPDETAIGTVLNDLSLRPAPLG